MISFIHSGGRDMASYRYRCEIPARQLNASINNLIASTLVFVKPTPNDVQVAKQALTEGGVVVADFCDDHFDIPHYLELLEIADGVTCPTKIMADEIQKRGRTAKVIPDPYEFDEVLPHCNGDRVLWFGHATNIQSLVRVWDDLPGKLTIVSNIEWAKPWMHDEMPQNFSNADVVILPATAPYKSCNRALEAIRQGCFVVAEPHPSLEDLPGIWVGNIKEGVAWATHNQKSANERTREAQNYIRERYSPRTLGSAWKTLLQKVKLRSTSAPEPFAGMDGSTSTDSMIAPT